MSTAQRRRRAEEVLETLQDEWMSLGEIIALVDLPPKAVLAGLAYLSDDGRAVCQDPNVHNKMWKRTA